MQLPKRRSRAPSLFLLCTAKQPAQLPGLSHRCQIFIVADVLPVDEDLGDIPTAACQFHDLPAHLPLPAVDGHLLEVIHARLPQRADRPHTEGAEPPRVDPQSRHAVPPAIVVLYPSKAYR